MYWYMTQDNSILHIARQCQANKKQKKDTESTKTRTKNQQTALKQVWNPQQHPTILRYVQNRNIYSEYEARRWT